MAFVVLVLFWCHVGGKLRWDVFCVSNAIILPFAFKVGLFIW